MININVWYAWIYANSLCWLPASPHSLSTDSGRTILTFSILTLHCSAPEPRTTREFKLFLSLRVWNFFIFLKHFFPPSPDMVNAAIKDDQDASNRRRNHFRKLKMCFHRSRMELMMSTRFNLFLRCALCWGERTPSAGHFHPIESCREWN